MDAITNQLGTVMGLPQPFSKNLLSARYNEADHEAVEGISVGDDADGPIFQASG